MFLLLLLVCFLIFFKRPYAVLGRSISTLPRFLCCLDIAFPPSSVPPATFINVPAITLSIFLILGNIEYLQTGVCCWSLAPKQLIQLSAFFEYRPSMVMTSAIWTLLLHTLTSLFISISWESLINSWVKFGQAIYAGKFMKSWLEINLEIILSNPLI